jgi:two-component system CheB/CheR fusion protein
MRVVRDAGAIIEHQSSKLGRLVDDLLDVSRMRRGLIEVKREAVDIETVVNNAVATIMPTIRAKEQRIKVSRAAPGTRVEGDAVRLEQVLVNLLENASKFSEPATSIDVSVRRADTDVIIAVRDQGIGIDPQSMPLIFDLFMQADRSLDRGSGGLGIGLTLVKRIVELHGGAVEASSAGVGRGAEFAIRLPCSPTTATLPAPPRADSGARRFQSVLVVEDNVDAAESLRMVLSQAGHEVAVAYDATSALSALEQFAPTWVFADIGLPGIDGFALAGMIRAHDRGREARLYAISGYGREEDRRLALASGFDGHLTKPVDPKILLTLLSEGPVAISGAGEPATEPQA